MATRENEIAEDEEQPVKSSGKGKGIIKWVLIALGLVMLVGVSVGTSIYFMNSLMHNKSGAQDTAQSQGDTAKHKEEKSKKEQKTAIYYKIDPPFVVNFQGENGNQFLQVTIELMTYDPQVIPAIEKHMPVIRNNLVFLLSSVDYKQISTLEGKQKLRADTLAEIQKVLKEKIGKPGVEEVYFTSIVMQ